MSKVYSVNTIKQLIDLNGDLTNFEIQFRVKSEKNEPFYALVADQTTLDNNPQLEYKFVETGEIGGTIKQDKGVYQNFFLVLKADNPCNCLVEIQKKEIPKAVDSPKMMNNNVITDDDSNRKKNGFKWIKILLVVAVIAIAGIAYWYYSKRKNLLKNSNNIMIPKRESLNTIRRPLYLTDNSKPTGLDSSLSNQLPTQSLPTQSLPTQSLPTQSLPTQSLPTQSLPANLKPTSNTPQNPLLQKLKGLNLS